MAAEAVGASHAMRMAKFAAAAAAAAVATAGPEFAMTASDEKTLAAAVVVGSGPTAVA
jgi:hypothetical protein